MYFLILSSAPSRPLHPLEDGPLLAHQKNFPLADEASSFVTGM